MAQQEYLIQLHGSFAAATQKKYRNPALALKVEMNLA